MFPVNPRELQKQLKQLKKLGVKIDQIENARSASIELGDKIIILEKPDVFVVEFGGQKTFYIVSQNIREEPRAAEEQATKVSQASITDEDIQFIVEYTGVSPEKAREAMAKANGDIAKAIEIIEREKRGSTS